MKEKEKKGKGKNACKAYLINIHSTSVVAVVDRAYLQQDKQAVFGEKNNIRTSFAFIE